VGQWVGGEGLRRADIGHLSLVESERATWDLGYFFYQIVEIYPYLC